MSEKLYQYQGYAGRVHELRSITRDKIVFWKKNMQRKIQNIFIFQNSVDNYPEDWSAIYRHKTTRELVRISAAVMGIEFSYAAETAFVSPTLLKIGIKHEHMTLIWALSPLIGFFFTPLLGSLSDRCRLRIGRRRPFICIMSLGVLLGLILVPNGEILGCALGDKCCLPFINSSRMSRQNILFAEIEPEINFTHVSNNITFISKKCNTHSSNAHRWGVILTILGTVLLDFNADACQSPARAYLLDVTVPEDHARGLSTFTVMAGLGGFFGYSLGGINWDVTFLGILFGGHVRAVFTIITVLFIMCVTYTITSFREIPLYVLESTTVKEGISSENDIFNVKYDDYGTSKKEEYVLKENIVEYSTLNEEIYNETKSNSVPSLSISVMVYLKSIIYMPYSIKMLCITNLFCWMAHVCYSLYFTDFVGEAVFNGRPMAAQGTLHRQLYESGVRFGCWGMATYSLSCACYSMKIEQFIKIFGCKKVYVGGLLIYSVGMLLMALTKNEFGVIIFSWTAGIMYSTLFTMPYLIIAHYHTYKTFHTNEDKMSVTSNQIRGLGTDIAIISSMVFLAQFLLSICMGPIVNATGTTTAVISVASVLALFASISASQIIYLDL